jgi:hypothetical protein
MGTLGKESQGRAAGSPWCERTDLYFHSNYGSYHDAGDNRGALPVWVKVMFRKAHNLMAGFTSEELPRQAIVVLATITVVLALIVALPWLTEADKPSITLYRTPGTYANISGKDLTIMIDQDRERPPCALSKFARQLIHIPDGVDPRSGQLDGAVLVTQTNVVYTSDGKHKFPLYLKLDRELPKYPSGNWYYQGVLYNGCSLLSKITGMDSPISTGLILAKVNQ